MHRDCATGHYGSPPFIPRHGVSRGPPSSGTDPPGGDFETGRSISSIRQEVNGVAGRWARSARALREGDRAAGLALASLARSHASDAFYGCDDPLEASLFSVLVELRKKAGSGEETCRDEDPVPDPGQGWESADVDP